jgi:hypothetical protein
MKIRTQLKAGGWNNHNETVKVRDVRSQLKTTSLKADRIQLMVVRAGLRAGIRGIRSLGKRG